MADIGAVAGAAGTIASALNGSKSSGGGVNSASNFSRSTSDSYSNVFGTAATLKAQAAAAAANASAQDAWENAADYNARQAAAQRAWEEYMSNTQYQRAVADMKAAGLNPILAASNGISGASVGSGAAASIGAANTYQAQTFADQNSASHADSYGEGHSSGSNWYNSESGLATGLGLLANSIDSTLSALNSSHNIQLILNGMKAQGFNDFFNTDTGKTIQDQAKDTWSAAKSFGEKISKGIGNIGNKIKKWNEKEAAKERKYSKYW